MSVEDKSNSYTSSRAYSHACTDVAYCRTNTCTHRRSHGKRDNPQRNGSIPFVLSLIRFLFRCIRS
jgi:hypothetical protein